MSGININVLNGTGVTFGTVSQGDGVVITAGAQTTTVQADAALAEACDAIDQAGSHRPGGEVDAATIAQLKAELAELRKAIGTGRPGRWASFGDAARMIYEKYGWAAIPLRKLFGVLLPGWLPA